MGRWLSWPWVRQETTPTPKPGEEEKEQHPPSPIPLDAIPVQLEDVLAQAIFKDRFQCFFEQSHQRLYLLMRDSVGYAGRSEGRIPVMILDESRLAQSILLLQRALRKMQEEQAKQSPQSVQALLDGPWPRMSHTPNPLVTWLSTSQDLPIWQSFEPSYAFFQEATAGNSPHFFDEEDNEDDWYDDEEWDEDDDETDDGHGYSSYS